MREKWGVGGTYQLVIDITGNILGMVNFMIPVLVSGTDTYDDVA